MEFQKDTALELLQLNELAYTLATTGHCVMPEGFSVPIPIRMPVDGRTLLLKGDQLDIWGFVTVKDLKIYIVFRGTEILSGFQFAEEWVLDAVSLPLRKMGQGKVHLGFYDAWSSLRNATINAIRATGVADVHTGRIIVGHSLGAAIATLCWADFGGDLLTFASPRVGDNDFAHALWMGQTVRIINHDDIVPKVPTDPPFRHGGTEVVVFGPGANESWHVSHRLESYRVGIEKL